MAWDPRLAPNRSSRFEKGSNVFYAKFAGFIKLLEESDYDISYLDGGVNTTALARAYWSFLQAVKDEVRRVEGDGPGSRA